MSTIDPRLEAFLKNKFEEEAPLERKRLEGWEAARRAESQLKLVEQQLVALRQVPQPSAEIAAAIEDLKRQVQALYAVATAHTGPRPTPERGWEESDLHRLACVLYQPRTGHPGVTDSGVEVYPDGASLVRAMTVSLHCCDVEPRARHGRRLPPSLPRDFDACLVALRGFSEQRVRIRAGHGRVFASFRPPELAWLRPDIGALTPEEQPAIGKAEDKPFNRRAVFLTNYEHGTVVVRHPVSISSERHRAEGLQQGPVIHREWILTFEELIDRELKATGGELDLGHVYEGPIAAGLQSEVLRLSIRLADTPWTDASEHPTSAQVQATIQQDWERFLHAPWSDQIVGPLAKLKYLVESGERPRMWAKGITGHYGLLLRTRDHTWLRAEMYIDVRQDPISSAQTIEVFHSEQPDGGVVCRIGRLQMRVHEHQ